MKTLGINIKRAREYQNFTQEYVAQCLGISQASYSNMENGKTKISSARLRKIAQVLKTEEYKINNFSPWNLANENINEWSAVRRNLNNLIELYERLLKQKNEEIAFLKKLLK